MFSLFLLAFSLSIDAFGLGAIYGMKKIRLPFFSRLCICTLSVLCAYVATLLGHFLSFLFPPSAGEWISTGLLILLGISMLRGKQNPEKPVKPHTPKELRLVFSAMELTITIVKNPAKGDINHSSHIDLKEAVYIGLALSLDALSAGIGQGILSSSPVFALSCGLFQFLLLSFGELLGKAIHPKTPLFSRLCTYLPPIFLFLIAGLRLLKI